MRHHALPVTMLPPSPEEDRHNRVVRYAIMMGIRVVCILLCVVIPWPWAAIPALGAVFIPYFAVLVANAAGGTMRKVEQPELRSTAVTRLSEEPGQAEPGQHEPDASPQDPR